MEKDEGVPPSPKAMAGQGRGRRKEPYKKAGGTPKGFFFSPCNKSVIFYNIAYRKNSRTKTVIQQITATGKSPALNQAAIMPIRRAAEPVHGDFVVWIMAGNVITDNVI